MNGKAYIIASSNLWLFNPSDNSFTNIVNGLPEGMNFTTMFSISDRIFIGTGEVAYAQSFADVATTAVYEFNPLTKIFSKRANFSGKARRLASAFSLNNKGYLLTGETLNQVNANTYQYDRINDMWEYDPIADSWTASQSYPGLGTLYHAVASSNEVVIIGAGAGPGYGSFASDFWTFK